MCVCVCMYMPACLLVLVSLSSSLALFPQLYFICFKSLASKITPHMTPVHKQSAYIFFKNRSFHILCLDNAKK